MNQNKVVLYAHAGSGNHGCEALANTICKLINKPVVLVTNSVEEDQNYSLKDLCEIVSERNIRKHKLIHILYYGNMEQIVPRKSYFECLKGKSTNKQYRNF